MVNCCKKLKELKSKTNTIKQAAKDCLINIKLLSFIPLNKFDYFYDLIKTKYKNIFSGFFKYFDKNYIKGKVFDKKIWNYSILLLSNVNNDIIVYTNNIIESFHFQLNKRFIDFVKRCKKDILDIIELYNMKNKYIEKKLV